MTSLIGTRARKNKGFTPGFTLLELILVILLVSVIIGLSTPLFRRTFSDLELSNTALNLAKMINYAQEMAIIDRTEYKLRMDVEKGRYRLMKLVLADNRMQYADIKGRYGKTFELPEGLKFDIDESASGDYMDYDIYFYPDGRRPGEIRIRILDIKANTGRVLEIKGFGSRVKVGNLE